MFEENKTDLHGFLIQNGNLKRWFRGVLMWVEVVSTLVGLRFDIYIFGLFGVVMGSIGMHAVKAAMVNVKPLKGWGPKK